MKLDLTHHFTCTPEELWALTESDAFEAHLAEASASKRETIADTREGGVRTVRRRITANRTLPGPFKKVLGTDQIRYDQVTVRADGANRLEWRIEPEVLKGRFQGAGETIVEATANGCSRRIVGELTIKVPLVGGQMEKKLVDDVERSYTKAAEIIRKLLAENAK